MEPEQAPSGELARRQAGNRPLALIVLVVILGPLVAGAFGFGHDYLPSPWWLSQRDLAWTICGAAIAAIMALIWIWFRRIKQLLPEAKRPPVPPFARAGLLVMVLIFAGWWVNNMQAVVLPKLLHVFSHPEHASVPFMVQGGSARHRFDCRTIEVAAGAYGEVDVCIPAALRASPALFSFGRGGNFDGSETIYGFWIEAMYLDEFKK